ncbi:hypothetical protein GGX14DRAFT_362452 [Mycena pura]|uniref:Transposase Tc1-like domain-containing protein n=1 Tax=Mycena pura TaxID=153505 RepID=A0AAD6VHS2_9AGAR|nr:hypothetical protein GGX14DRAFT_362452 [Mycena pura]
MYRKFFFSPHHPTNHPAPLPAFTDRHPLCLYHNVRRAAREHGIHPATAQSLWRKFQETGATSNLPRSGRPAFLSSPEKALVVQYAVEHRREPFRDIRNKMSPAVSASTIRRTLAEDGYHRRVAKKVPYRSEKTKQKRLTWGREQAKNMSAEDWANIAWSDEAYVCLDDKKGRIWVTRRVGEELLDECCVPAVPQSPIRGVSLPEITKGRWWFLSTLADAEVE